MTSFRDPSVVCHVCHETFENRDVLDRHWGAHENSEVARLQHDNIELRTEKNELMTKMNSYRSANARKTRDNVVKTLEREMEALREKVTSLQEKNLALLKRNRPIRRSASSATNVASPNSATTNRYRQDIAAKNRRIEELEVNLLRLRKQLKAKDHNRSRSVVSSPSRSSHGSRSPSPYSPQTHPDSTEHKSDRPIFSPTTSAPPTIHLPASMKRKMIRTNSTTKKPLKRRKPLSSPNTPKRRRSTGANPSQRRSPKSPTSQNLHAQNIRRSQSEHPKNSNDSRLRHKPRMHRSNSMRADAVHPLGGSALQRRRHPVDVDIEVDHSSQLDNDEPTEQDHKQQEIVLRSMTQCVERMRVELNAIRNDVRLHQRSVDEQMLAVAHECKTTDEASSTGTTTAASGKKRTSRKKRLAGLRKKVRRMKNQLRNSEMYRATLKRTNQELNREMTLNFCRVRILLRTCDMYREAIKLFKRRTNAMYVHESQTGSVYFEDCTEF